MLPEASAGLAPIGLAIVGCGRISASHLAAVTALPDSFRLVAAVDRKLEQAEASAAPFDALSFDSLAAALALPQVEAVLLCSPNALHAPQAMRAIAAGKHVLVEKPMAESGAEAQAMADAARSAGVVLAVGHTFRHGAAVRYLQDNRATFGRLRAVEVSQCVFWDGPQAPWWAERTPEEGLILSLFAPHALDFIQLVMDGDDPLRVHTEAARHQPGWQAEDEAMIVMAYPGKRMASLHISYNQRRVFDRKVLFFDAGVLEITDGEYLSWNGELLVSPGEGTVSDGGSMGGRDLSGYFRTQLAEFAAALRGQPHRSCTGDEAARLIALMERVRVSARANSADAIDSPPEG